MSVKVICRISCHFCPNSVDVPAYVGIIPVKDGDHFYSFGNKHPEFNARIEPEKTPEGWKMEHTFSSNDPYRYICPAEHSIPQVENE